MLRADTVWDSDASGGIGATALERMVTEIMGGDFTIGGRAGKAVMVTSTMGGSNCLPAMIVADDAIAKRLEQVWRHRTRARDCYGAKRAHGSHKSTYCGIPASGMHATIRGLDVFRLVERKIVEQWTYVDHDGLLDDLNHLGQIRHHLDQLRHAGQQPPGEQIDERVAP